jgi:hypothetical protein
VLQLMFLFALVIVSSIAVFILSRVLRFVMPRRRASIVALVTVIGGVIGGGVGLVLMTLLMAPFTHETLQSQAEIFTYLGGTVAIAGVAALVAGAACSKLVE